jgi:hypothetical protein
VIGYRAILDVPRELVRYVSRLLAAERRAIGTRKGTRALTSHRQALLVLVWFRKNEDKALLGAGFGVSRSTAYRYVAEAVAVLSTQAPDLHQALNRVAADGWSHVILDGKLFRTDRLSEATTSVKGEQIDAWYSGKHRAFGANIQALFRPDGLPVWTSDALPGHLHDLTCTTPRPNNLPTATSSASTTAPATHSCDHCAATANEASPCSPAAGTACATSPPAPAVSATSSAPRSYSPNSGTDTYPILVEITSMYRAIALRACSWVGNAVR